MKEIESLTVDGAPCLRVRSYRALVRVAGYFKYNAHGNVLFRGQTRCFGSMRASLHRGETPPSDRVIDAFLNRYRAALNVDMEPKQRLTTEPLLQHYGLNTRWLDVVDSLPHALFFATHTLCTGQAPNTDTYAPSLEDEGFLYVLDLGQLKHKTIAGEEVVGYSRSKNLAVVDLRALKPSNALRPHAQHGLLIRATSSETDLWPSLVARIAVPTQEARQWITSASLEREALFPPRVWDNIYETLLSNKMSTFLRSENPLWGKILKFDFAP